MLSCVFDIWSLLFATPQRAWISLRSTRFATKSFFLQSSHILFPFVGKGEVARSMKMSDAFTFHSKRQLTTGLTATEGSRANCMLPSVVWKRKELCLNTERFPLIWNIVRKYLHLCSRKCKLVYQSNQSFNICPPPRIWLWLLPGEGGFERCLRRVENFNRFYLLFHCNMPVSFFRFWLICKIEFRLC